MQQTHNKQHKYFGSEKEKEEVNTDQVPPKRSP